MPDIKQILTDLTDSDTEGKRLPARPWQMEISGEQWACATDGRMCLLAKGQFGFDPMSENNVETIHKLFQLQSDSRTVELEAVALRDWAGEYDPGHETQCSDCRGSGTCHHCGNGDCPTCDGEGTEWECGEIRRGKILRFVVDRNKVARALLAISAERVKVSVSKRNRDCHPLRIDAGNVTAIVMGVADCGEECAVFEEARPLTRSERWARELKSIDVAF